MELVYSKCNTEGCDRNCNFTHEFVGRRIVVRGHYSASLTFTWESSHVKLNKAGSRVYTDNLDIASCAVISGNNFGKVELYFEFLNVPFTQSPLFIHINDHICDRIYKNHPYSHNLYFKKYHFEMLKRL